MWWPAVVKSEWEFPLRLDYGRSPQAYVNQRLKIQLELLMMSGMLLETCWAFNERWNNKFYYKVASCWLFLLSHTAMHGSMNIKFIDKCRCCITDRSICTSGLLRNDRIVCGIQCHLAWVFALIHGDNLDRISFQNLFRISPTHIMFLHLMLELWLRNLECVIEGEI